MRSASAPRLHHAGLLALLLLGMSYCHRCSGADADPAAPKAKGGGKKKNMASGAAMYEATLGDQALKKRKLKAAMGHYAKAIKMDPENTELYMKRATAYMVTGKSTKAMADLSRVIKKDPKNVKALLKRGRVFRASGNFEDALKDYQKVQQLQPKNKKIEKDLPVLMEATEQARVAKEYYSYAKNAEEKDDHGTARHWYQQVHEQLEQALKVAPDAFSLLLMASEAMLSMGSYADVIQSTGRLLKMRPDSLDGFLLRGKAYLYEGEVDFAFRHFKEGYKSDSSHKKLKIEYKRIKKYNKLKGKCEAEQNVNTCSDALKAMHGDDGTGAPELDVVTIKLREMHCKFLANNGLAEDAMNCANRVLQHDGDSVEAYKWRGKANLLLENWDQAVHDYTQAVQKSGNGDQEARDGLDEAQRMLHKSKQKDYYGTLEVAKDANAKQIKKAYYKAAQAWHPDKHTGDEAKEAAEVKFKEIAEAYEILSDDETRGKFDRGEEIKPEGNGGGGHNPFQHFQHGGQQFHFNF